MEENVKAAAPAEEAKKNEVSKDAEVLIQNIIETKKNIESIDEALKKLRANEEKLTEERIKVQGAYEALISLGLRLNYLKVGDDKKPDETTPPPQTEEKKEEK